MTFTKERVTSTDWMSYPILRFKESPSVTVGIVYAGAHTVYLGKGDKLRTRLRTYARFGAGDPKAAHWGGRYIWQLADAAELLVAWRELGDRVETARLDEIALLARSSR